MEQRIEEVRFGRLLDPGTRRSLARDGEGREVPLGLTDH